ncbi:MAG: twin-arginine translocase subunit TatC [Alphaproteobacteria bacterium]|nr:twin-arginine translocase subunit TatC [Alphaproteobacteria bacterium]
MDEEEIEATKAPLMDHLMELRTRLLWTLVAFAVAFVGCYVFAEPIYGMLVHPLDAAFAGQEGRRMIFTALYEGFLTYVRVAFFGALCLTFPIAAIQVWKFVAPGLYRNERSAFFPYLVATPVMFATGAMFVYFFVMPMAIQFFLSFETPGSAGGLPIQLEAKVGEYLDLIMALIFAFGLSFQLPIILTLMGHVGLISSDYLVEYRRYAIVIVFAIAAVITPPDVLSQVGLAVPMLLLYEGSIWIIRAIERARGRKVEEASAE